MTLVGSAAKKCDDPVQREQLVAHLKRLKKKKEEEEANISQLQSEVCQLQNLLKDFSLPPGPFTYFDTRHPS